MEISFCLIIDDLVQHPAVLTVKNTKANENTLLSDILEEYNNDPKSLINCIFRGRCLNQDSSLNSLDIKNGSVLKVVKSPKSVNEPEKEKVDYAKMVTHIIKLLKHILKTQKRDFLSKMISKEAKRIIRITDDIQNNPVTYSIATNVNLLQTLFSCEENVMKVLQKHPILIPEAYNAIKIVHNIINDYQTGSRTSQYTEPGTSNSRFFSLQEVEMSDDSNFDDSEESSDTSRTGLTSNRPVVTRSNLRQALNRFENVPRRGRAGVESSRQNRVSLNQLRNAIQNAQNLENTSTTSSILDPEPQPEPMDVEESQPQTATNVGLSGPTLIEEGIQKIMAMGFTDENAIRVALEASGGNIEAAIDLLMT